MEPRHFQFVTVVKQRDKKPGGWRAACVHVNIQRTTGESFLFFGSATPESGLGLLCEAFKKTFGVLLDASIRGSRVKTACHEKTIPVQFGELVL